MTYSTTRNWLSFLWTSTARKDGPSNNLNPVSRFSDTKTLLARADLLPADRAAFAVISRLIASIVTEGLLEAAYIPVRSTHCAGLCVVLSSSKRSQETFHVNDIFAFVPLHHTPILKSEMVPLLEGRRVWLLDPFDMVPAFYYLQNGSINEEPDDLASLIRSTLLSRPLDLSATFTSTQSLDPMFWWTRFASFSSLSSELQDSLGEEIRSSFIWQQSAYSTPQHLPPLTAIPVSFEQALLEGHPTHPMHRARRTLPPLPPVSPLTRDWYAPRIRFALVDRARVDCLGEFEGSINALMQIVEDEAGQKVDVPEGKILIPVYDLQVEMMKGTLKGIEVLPKEVSLQAQAQASLRTLVIPDYPYALKLPINLKISSASRTVSHFTANHGPRFSVQILPRLAIDSSILHVEPEVASAVVMRNTAGRQTDEDMVKHATAVLREYYVPQKGENVIICAVLGESGYADLPVGEPAVCHLFGLGTQRDKLEFFDEYTRILLAALIPLLIINGLAFEAHPQNTLVRISVSPGAKPRVLGFVMRDLGGIRVHPPTLLSSTNTPQEAFQYLPNHVIVTKTREAAAARLYNTLVQNHLQRLARVLGLHYSGEAWCVVREYLEREITRQGENGRWLHNFWMHERASEVEGKCLLKMKLVGSYRETIYTPFPNLIQFRPQLESSQEIVKSRGEGTGQMLAALGVFWSIALVVRGWFARLRSGGHLKEG